MRNLMVIIGIVVVIGFLLKGPIEDSILQTLSPERDSMVIEKAAILKDINANKGNNLIDIFSSVALLERAQKELREIEKFKGKAIVINDDLRFYNKAYSNIYIAIVNPDNPEQSDMYTWSVKAGWKYDEPVKKHGSLDKEKLLVDSVDFTDIHKMYVKASEEAITLEGAEEPDYFYLISSKYVKPQHRFHCTVSGSRENLNLDFTLKGELLKKEVH